MDSVMMHFLTLKDLESIDVNEDWDLVKRLSLKLLVCCLNGQGLNGTINVEDSKSLATSPFEVLQCLSRFNNKENKSLDEIFALGLIVFLVKGKLETCYFETDEFFCLCRFH